MINCYVVRLYLTYLRIWNNNHVYMPIFNTMQWFVSKNWISLQKTEKSIFKSKVGK